MSTAPLYTYDNCHKRHEEHPDTFEIPTAGEIAGLLPGDYVKLIFELPEKKPGSPSAERMWVEIESVLENGEFIGKLANDPVFVKGVNFRDLVAPFRIEHIASVMYNRKENPAPHFRDPREVFDQLVKVMEADNGGEFTYTRDQCERAISSITMLQLAGFFADDPSDIDGSYWTCAAGEFTEAKEYFSRAPEAYETLSEILNEVFES